MANDRLSDPETVISTAPVSCPAATGIAAPPLNTVHELFICAIICSCDTQWCVSQKLWALDDNFQPPNGSLYKAEVPYDMGKRPPAPVMSRNNPKRATRRRPKGSRIPDVVVVKRGDAPPTQDNIQEVIEIKFPGDSYSDGQEAAYARIAGDAELKTLSPEVCGCDGKKQTNLVPATEKQREETHDAIPAWEKAVLILALVAIVLDDVIGQAEDDVLIPVIMARLGWIAR